jgi:hypothetical protein
MSHIASNGGYLGAFTALQQQKLTSEYFKLWRDTALRESAKSGHIASPAGVEKPE